MKWSCWLDEKPAQEQSMAEKAAAKQRLDGYGAGRADH